MSVDARPATVTPRRILIVYNPTAGSRRRRSLDSVVTELMRLGCQVFLRPTRARGDAETITAKATLAEVDVLAIAGGDGTINEAINGLTSEAPPLALIPLGTANVLAAEIGLRADPLQIAHTIAHGRTVDIALGCANGRRFALMASVGLDAHVVEQVSIESKKWLGKTSYVLEGLRQFFSFPFPTYRLEIDGSRMGATQVIVANGRFYAGRFLVAPSADLEDDLFQICLFTGKGRWRALFAASALLANRLPRQRRVEVHPGRRIVIEGPAGEPVQADGDVLTRLPVDITMIPDAVQLIVPATDDDLP